MKLRKAFRASFAFIAGALILVGIGGSASADTIDVYLTGQASPNVCSIDPLTFSNGLSFYTLWTGTAWPTISESSSFHVMIRASGGPTDRYCKITWQSTSGFMNGATQFLPASSLTIDGYQLSSIPAYVNPNVPTAGVDFGTHTLGIDGNPSDDKPALSYTATISYTFSTAP